MSLPTHSQPYSVFRSCFPSHMRRLSGALLPPRITSLLYMPPASVRLHFHQCQVNALQKQAKAILFKTVFCYIFSGAHSRKLRSMVFQYCQRKLLPSNGRYVLVLSCRCLATGPYYSCNDPTQFRQILSPAPFRK